MVTTKAQILLDIAALLAKVVVVRKTAPAACGTGPDYLIRLETIETDLATLAAYVTSEL